MSRNALVTLGLILCVNLSASARHHSGGGQAPAPQPGQGSSNGGSGVGQPVGNSSGLECFSQGQVLPVDDAQVLQWRNSTPNQFRSRGHIQGYVDEVFDDATGHHHFSARIGNNPEDHVEIIYNEGFGIAMPTPQVGESVEACGDYITSNAPSGGYPASPDGALIHWVHKSDTPNHDNGFVVLSGVVYGGL